MSTAKQALGFLLVAGIVSVFLAYAGAIASSFDDGFRDFDLLKGLFAPLLLVPIYAVFVMAGGLIVGLPALLVMRETNLASRRAVLVPAGLVLGAGASVALLATWLGIAVIPIALSFGAASGGLSALLWWNFVERHREMGGTDD